MLKAKDETVESTDAEVTPEGDETEATNPDKDRDLDAEIAREKAADPEKASEAFKERQSKRKEEEEEEGDDKPVTKKDLAEVEARATARANADRLGELASSMTDNSKIAELMLLTHKNRFFPNHLSLKDQMEEVYLIVNKKRLLGERDEALRALKGREGINSNSANTHRDPQVVSEPKISGTDRDAMVSAGYKWNSVSRKMEKKLPDGSTLIYDPKTKQSNRV